MRMICVLHNGTMIFKKLRGIAVNAAGVQTAKFMYLENYDAKDVWWA